MKTTDYATIYLMRHAETKFNLRELYQGHIDSELSETGEQQSRQRAKELVNVHFDTVYSSDLARTQRTAEIITAERKLEIKANAFLKERFFGKFEGKHKDELISEYKQMFDEYEKLVGKDRAHFTFSGEFESFDQMSARMFAVLREIALANLGKTVLVVSHGSVMRSVLAHLDQKYYKTRTENTGYVVLACDGVEFEILRTVGIE